jgi:hypothetical protein
MRPGYSKLTRIGSQKSGVPQLFGIGRRPRIPERWGVYREWPRFISPVLRPVQ